ncbi:uncharacterized protein LOC120118711 isoform X2 [Hibiscus syriacus]|uniref:uncharacterized protein LOC120118711 isoform X2 n=1 Tax=Hibiscus syriacus TaxID=106335 RepID=UPI0019222CE9|nr:uncharacterized protein LOC120118711 isoform X2 [Hibiscus syriacus]
MNSHVPSNAPWTDEKHVHFLNSMEAWFVRTMFENNSDRYNLRLDRQLPDSSDSTLDCKHHNVPTRKKHASSDSIGTTRSKMKVKTDKRLKRPPPQRPPPPPPQSQPHDSSPDQVVPQVGNGTEDKD